MDVVLVGRSAEREVLGGLLARTAEGYSGTLVLRGEAGVGKTALLDETFAAAVAGGIQTARLTGVEAETQLGYAGLHRLLLPFAGQLERGQGIGDLAHQTVTPMAARRCSRNQPTVRISP